MGASYEIRNFGSVDLAAQKSISRTIQSKTLYDYKGMSSVFLDALASLQVSPVSEWVIPFSTFGPVSPVSPVSLVSPVESQ